MTKKVSEKEKIFRKALRMIERLVAEGESVSRARSAAGLKYGFSQPTLIKYTMHLSPRAHKDDGRQSEANQ